MTEAEWLGCTDPAEMVDYLCRNCKATRLKSGRRKLRLFACACCRELSHLLPEPRSQAAVEVSEQYADGQTDKGGLAKAVSVAEGVKVVLGRALTAVAVGHPDPAAQAAWILAGAVVDAVAPFPVEVVVRLVLGQTGLAVRAATGEGSSVSTAGLAALYELYRHQCGLVRDIFGPLPFRSVPIDHSLLKWHGGTIPKLAEAIYDERAFDRLPILADALEEAGCTNDDILGHCRGPGPHVKGCWVVDLVLGKG